VLTLAGIILVAGVAGGVVNHWLHGENLPLTKSVGLGVAAATMVPMVLNIASSTLVQQVVSGGAAEHHAIFAGFCLAAAIYSTNFIKAAANKAFEGTLKVTKERAEKAESDISLLFDLSREATSGPVAPALQLTDNERQILSKIRLGNYHFRSLAGLCETTGLRQRDAAKALCSLSERGYVGSVKDHGETFYYQTQDAKRLSFTHDN
jgi:hypothetical protein